MYKCALKSSWRSSHNNQSRTRMHTHWVIFQLFLHLCYVLSVSTNWSIAATAALVSTSDWEVCVSHIWLMSSHWFNATPSLPPTPPSPHRSTTPSVTVYWNNCFVAQLFPWPPCASTWWQAAASALSSSRFHFSAVTSPLCSCILLISNTCLS